MNPSAMPKIYVHLLIGRAPDDMQGSIILESPPSHNLCEYTVWHSYEHPSMLRLGARSKKKLGPLWAFPPMQKAVSNHHGQPIENDQKSMMTAMNSMTPHQWGARLFDTHFYDAYIMSSRHEGCDVYMQAPGDTPIRNWYHYWARTMGPNPHMWWRMPLAEPEFLAIEDRPEYTGHAYARLPPAHLLKRADDESIRDVGPC